MKINMVKKGSFYVKKIYFKLVFLSGVNITRVIVFFLKYDFNINIYSRYLYFF